MSLLSDVVGSPVIEASGGAGRYSHFRIVSARHPWRRVGTLVSILTITGILDSVLGNPCSERGVFTEWFFSEPALAGLGRTLLLTALGAAFGFPAGRSPWRACSPLMEDCVGLYLLFRSIPLTVLLLILNKLGYLYETIWLGIPFTSIKSRPTGQTHPRAGATRPSRQPGTPERLRCKERGASSLRTTSSGRGNKSSSG